jgi:hypothetical protein
MYERFYAELTISPPFPTLADTPAGRELYARFAEAAAAQDDGLPDVLGEDPGYSPQGAVLEIGCDEATLESGRAYLEALIERFFAPRGFRLNGEIGLVEGYYGDGDKLEVIAVRDNVLVPLTRTISFG